MHLRTSDVLGNLGLRQLVKESKADDRPLPLPQGGNQRAHCLHAENFIQPGI